MEARMTKQPRFRLHKSLIAFSTLLLIAAGVVSSALAQSELADSQVLRYATDGRQFPPLDPSLGANNISFPVQNMVFDSLVRFAPGSPRLDEIEPALAESWEASPDASVW